VRQTLDRNLTDCVPARITRDIDRQMERASGVIGIDKGNRECENSGIEMFRDIQRARYRHGTREPLSGVRGGARQDDLAFRILKPDLQVEMPEQSAHTDVLPVH